MSSSEDKDEPIVTKCIMKPERTHVVITTERMLELMAHKDLQAACDGTQKVFLNRWPFTAFVVDTHPHFHPTGYLFANKVDTDAYACLMSELLEHVEKLFGRPQDVKNFFNDDDDAIFKGFKLVFPLASPNIKLIK